MNCLIFVLNSQLRVM